VLVRFQYAIGQQCGINYSQGHIATTGEDCVVRLKDLAWFVLCILLTMPLSWSAIAQTSHRHHGRQNNYVAACDRLCWAPTTDPPGGLLVCFFSLRDSEAVSGYQEAVKTGSIALQKPISLFTLKAKGARPCETEIFQSIPIIGFVQSTIYNFSPRPPVKVGDEVIIHAHSFVYDQRNTLFFPDPSP
jgi:hypothetical protein